MNQITQMFMESNNRMKRILKGGFKYEDIAAAQREFEGQIKLINAVVSAFGIASKNKRALSGLKNMNLMDDETAIDLLLGDPEDDKVKCPEQGRLLSSSECLDYSGDHNEECSGCDVGKSVKNKLCPTRQ